MEVRHSDWICERLFQTLEQNAIAFCMADTAGCYPYAEELTSDFVYIRLHGAKELYTSAYSERELRVWAEKIQCLEPGHLRLF